jgi:plastocyanin
LEKQKIHIGALLIGPIPQNALSNSLDQVMIGANKAASLVLTKAGIIEYYCHFHPNMKGRIIVTPGAK